MSGNDQAFPSLTGLRHTSPSHQQAETVGGLTKRELFAAMAMQGLCANSSPQISTWGSRQTADCSVQFADALLAELEKPHA